MKPASIHMMALYIKLYSSDSVMAPKTWNEVREHAMSVS